MFVEIINNPEQCVIKTPFLLNKRELSSNKQIKKRDSSIKENLAFSTKD